MIHKAKCNSANIMNHIITEPKLNWCIMKAETHVVVFSGSEASWRSAESMINTRTCWVTPYLWQYQSVCVLTDWWPEELTGQTEGCVQLCFTSPAHRALSAVTESVRLLETCRPSPYLHQHVCRTLWWFLTVTCLDRDRPTSLHGSCRPGPSLSLDTCTQRYSR